MQDGTPAKSTGSPVEATIQTALAPKGWSARQVVACLSMDPYQLRVSRYPIPLTHPRTGVQAPLAEYTERYLESSRFAIETSDALVFISRLFLGEEQIFKPTKIIAKELLK